MHCNGCANNIERTLQSRGYEGSSVQFASNTAYIPADTVDDQQKVLDTIRGLGYEVSVKDKKDKSHHHHDHDDAVSWKLIASVIFTIPLLLHMALSYPLLHDPLFQFFMATPVFLIGLQHFGSSALRSLRAGGTNMDVLIIIGVIASYGYSLYGSLLGLGPDYLFYETAAAIVCFVLVGNALEHRAVKRTTSALVDLAALQPQRAKRYNVATDTIEDVDIDEVKVGDVLISGSGEKIASDGRVENGEALIDESLVTGESEPIRKQKGDRVIAGTYVVSGSLHSKTTSLEEDSLLSKMIQLVSEAEKKKPSIQRLGDLVSSYFVPAVLICSALTLLISFFVLGIPLQEAMIRAVAVLVISCPCAMGLATPTAIMVGVGKAARKGIIIKGGDTLERLTNVKEVLFDKTGTLTDVRGVRIDVTDTSFDEKEVEQILYSLEKYSSHPLAKAITEALPDNTVLELSEIHEEKGTGISARSLDGDLFALKAVARGREGADIVLTKNKQEIATVHFTEVLFESVPDLISLLHKQGIRTHILSGDREEKVRKVAEESGVSGFDFKQQPDQKLAYLTERQSLHPIAFIGDGINDAPALAKADVGISLSNATDIAVQSADIILLGGKIEHLADAFQISSITLRTIKQNLFWAFFYNVFAIPVAAAGYLSPMVAALAMAFSDVIVIGNSLRIHFKRQ